MDKRMIEALHEFEGAMSDLIDACADLAEVEGRETVEVGAGVHVVMSGGGTPKGRGGSWERAIGYEQVLARFATARAAYLAIPDRE